MAEINKGEIVSKGALQEVYDLRDAILLSSEALKGLVKSGQSAGISIKAAQSTKQLSDETKKLTLAQSELLKIEKQIELASTKNTNTYIGYQKVLQQVKNEQKDRITLGQKDSKLINEQNASLKQLEVALNKNRLAYKNLADEEARSSKEGKELKAIIDQQDASVKKLNGGIGDFTDNVGNYEGSIKGLKIELRAARDEMARVATASGTTSKEFAVASEKAGEIKDKINDLNDALKNSSASKFENIGTSLKDVGSKLINLDFEGAATSAKQFATVVKSLTFAEVAAGIESLGNTLATVGKAILTNPLFIFAGVLAGIALTLKYFYDQQQKASALTIERYKKEEEALVSRYDKEINLQKIIGKQTFELEKDKQRVIIESATKQLEELTNRKKGIQDLIKLGLSLKEATKLADIAAQDALDSRYDEEKKKRIEELIKIRRDASNEIDIIVAEQAEFERKSDADLAKQKKEDLFNLNKFRIQVGIETEQEISNNEIKSYDERVKAVKKSTDLKNSLAKLEQKEALSQEKLTADAITLINEEYQNKIITNKKEAAKETKKINEDITKSTRDESVKATNEAIALNKKNILSEYNAAQQRLDNEKKNLELIAFARVSAGEDQNKVKEETDKKLLELERSLTDEYIQIQIDRVTKTLTIEGLSAEEQEALTKELYDLKSKLTDTYYSQLGIKSEKQRKIDANDLKAQIDNIKKILAEEKLSAEERESLMKNLADLEAKYQIQKLQNIQHIYQNFADSITTIFSAIRDKRIASLDAESKANSDKLAKDLLAAGNNEKLKQKLQEESAVKEAELQKRRRAEARKGAQTEKALAIVSAGIQAALAVLNALTTKPYPVGVILAVSAGLLGAAQVAKIATAPLPAYEKGTSYKPESGPAVVGEKGAELMRLPGGNLQLTPSVATIMDLPRGTKITPHADTMRILALKGLSQNGGSSQKENNSNELLNEVKQLNYNIKNIKHPKQPNLTRSGAIIYRGIQASDTHTKLVRDINLGRWL